MQTSTYELTLTTITFAEDKVGFVRVEDAGVRLHPMSVCVFPWGVGGKVSFLPDTDFQRRRERQADYRDLIRGFKRKSQEENRDERNL